jgi:hypothetical protein
MENIVKKFWHGQLTLWKSYWLIGELLNAVFVLIILNIEIRVLDNKLMDNFLPFIRFNNLHFLNKLILISWTVIITVGIWRSAENYRGPFMWIVITLIFLSYRLYGLRLIFF